GRWTRRRWTPRSWTPCLTEHLPRRKPVCWTSGEGRNRSSPPRKFFRRPPRPPPAGAPGPWRLGALQPPTPAVRRAGSPRRVRHMRLHFPAILPALVIAGPGSAETLREQSEATVGVRGFSAPRVDNSRGRVEIRPGAEGKIRVTALKIVRSGRESTRRDLANATTVETDVEGGYYVVRVRYPQNRSIHINLWEGFSTSSLPRTEVRLEIEVPPRLPVRLVSASGDLLTEGLPGRQFVKTVSGDIRIESAAGAVEASTASGDIEATAGRGSGQTLGGAISGERAGRVRDKSGGGDIGIRAPSDSLVLETVSGDIEVGHASRGVFAKSASGGVPVRPAAPDQQGRTAPG